ncbi:MAG TPA: sensor histidine kinase [Terriglobales bacterium]|nr:sensor histidine kinase [Terriglobales bacterium]
MWTPSRLKTRRTIGELNAQVESLVLERTLALQTFSQRLLRVQDDERRKVARDLHDSTGQTLCALKLSIAALQHKLGNNEGACDELSEIAKLADQALQEIRTTSYLLHPPLLDEAGFTRAAQWFVDGFAKRSGMKLHTDFTVAQVERLPDTIEIALFRVLQESLTNVHRHSGASNVDVRFRREVHAVILEVRDYGRGMPLEVLSSIAPLAAHSGVGLAGMRQRLHELRGTLEIESADPGTRLRATIPLAAPLTAEFVSSVFAPAWHTGLTPAPPASPAGTNRGLQSRNGN